jgi:hypothetical protein
MSEKLRPKWEPASEALLKDQIARYDKVRSRCPVAHTQQLHWSLFRHKTVLNNPNQFSNVVSNHVAVPNGFDPPEHKAYRRIIDPCPRQNSGSTELHPLTMLQACAQAVDFKVGHHFGEGHPNPPLKQRRFGATPDK